MMARSPIRVLLVEDNPGDVVLIRQMLAEDPRHRFEPIDVPRLADARDRLDRGGFGAVLLDLSLPDSWGLESFRAVRGLAPELPIVVLTGLDDEALAVEAVQEGAQDYLVKGQTDGRRLAHALSYALGRHQRQRLLEEAVSATTLDQAIARNIQQALLPRRVPQAPGLDVFGASYSAGAVGGDLFLYLPLPDGALGLAVADVTGHGTGAGLLMAAVRSYLRAFTGEPGDVGAVLERTNRLFAEDVTDGNNCTLLLARLDLADRTLRHASAGHPPGLVFAPNGEVKAQLLSTGLPLGIVAETDYPADEPVTLAPGDVVLLVTDGFKETRSPGGEWFGEERLVQAARDHLGDGARAVVEAVIQAANTFRGGRAQADDVTALAVRVTA